MLFRSVALTLMVLLGGIAQAVADDQSLEIDPPDRWHAITGEAQAGDCIGDIPKSVNCALRNVLACEVWAEPAYCGLADSDEITESFPADHRRGWAERSMLYQVRAVRKVTENEIAALRPHGILLSAGMDYPREIDLLVTLAVRRCYEKPCQSVEEASTEIVRLRPGLYRSYAFLWPADLLDPTLHRNWRRITRERKTTTSDCLGQIPRTPMCAVDNYVLCDMLLPHPACDLVFRKSGKPFKAWPRDRATDFAYYRVVESPPLTKADIAVWVKEFDGRFRSAKPGDRVMRVKVVGCKDRVCGPSYVAIWNTLLIRREGSRWVVTEFPQMMGFPSDLSLH